MIVGFRNGVMQKPYDAEVAYLESTGTQYIDTGYPINIGLGDSDEFMAGYTEMPSAESTYEALCGCQGVDSTGQTTYPYRYIRRNSTYYMQFIHCGYPQDTIPLIANAKYYVKTTPSSNITKITKPDGEVLDFSTTSISKFTTNILNVYLFGGNQNN